MAGTSKLSKLFAVRIPFALWATLKAIARARGVSVAAVLLEPWTHKMESGARPKSGRTRAR